MVIYTVREGQCHGVDAVIALAAGDKRPGGLDTAAYLRYIVMVWRRAALYCVTPREGGIRIAPISRDRSGANARRHAASEIEMQREPGSRVAVDELDRGHATASIAGQRQIARRD